MIKGLLVKLYHNLLRGEFGSKKWKDKFKYYGKGVSIGYPAIISLDKGNISISDFSIIKKNSRIQNFIEHNSGRDVTISIGKNCYIGTNFSILNASNVTIGDNVLIASYVLITSENHSIDPESTYEYKDQPLLSSPVIIGDGCWIGEKVIILPGVTIGKKCVIGAGSIVTKSIPDYSIVVGNPAKVIKRYNFQKKIWDKYNI